MFYGTMRFDLGVSPSELSEVSRANRFPLAACAAVDVKSEKKDS